ncbi:MAG: HNH endonuclease [Patescibacteria group bacterium]
MQCIYCNKKERETTFIGREHVLPRFMGVFENNPTIVGWVCDICNSKIFNPLETKFKEDTEEGIFYQMFNFGNSTQIRIRGENVKTEFLSGFREKFFDDIFPFLKWQDDDWNIFLLPQIKIKRYGGNGYVVILIEALKKLSNGKFNKLKKMLEGTESKDVSIFTGSNDENDTSSLQEAIEIVKSLGIPYKEGKRIFALTPPQTKKKQYEISMNCTIGHDAGRIIAKIAFNYFAFCALEEGRSDALFGPEFDKIKRYILGIDNPPIKEIIISVETNPIIFDEKQKGMRLLGHTITFSAEDGYIISKISFIGKKIYTVILGQIPKELNRADFGCAHIFDPINKKTLQLTQNVFKWGSGQEMGFGLFKRL